MTEEVYAARAALHMWEEPCISGKEGSGTVFFTGCPLGCVFCQNREIALGRKVVPLKGSSKNVCSDAGESSLRKTGSGAEESGFRKTGGDAEKNSLRKTSGLQDEAASEDIIGIPVNTERLAEVFLSLEAKHANNINLVTPTHFVPQIIDAVRLAREKGLSIPILYNTGSYETEETVKSLAGTVDIFLPDLKFMDPEISKRYASAPDYFEVASRAIREMVNISGEPVFDERGMMLRGTIVRHMVLPGHTKDSKRILEYLHETYGEKIYVSIMNQYTPMPGIEREYPELGRRVTKREYSRVVDYAIGLGMENVFIQEGPTAEDSFIPAFDGTGIDI